ncbi:MAG: NAD-dependent epimerase/dehydratase family protein [Opitutae bacterium]|nr:NAD-dependent epimerase/dehydratase family protein [Opitutae bacterium]
MATPAQTSPASIRQRLLPSTPAGYFRVIADACVLVGAVALAVLLRLVWMIAVEGHSPELATEVSVGSFIWTTLILVPVSIVTFSAFGFYTFGRSYESRYKVLTVLKGVAVASLIAALIVLLLRDNRDFSRGVLLLATAFAASALVLMRIGTRIWRELTRGERRLLARTERPRSLQRVLVVGGAGYIGSALIPKLLVEGYYVRVFDRMIYGEEAIADYLQHPRVEIVRADFRQVDAVVRAMQDVDSVVHLGAIVGDPACALNEQLTIDINLMATRMVAEVAKGLGIQRFIFASTCSVYGASNELLDEHSQLNPVSLYAKTKIACERVLLKMADEQFHPVILRFSTIYGLSGRTRFDLVINLLTAKAHFDGEITVSGGDQWRPFVHVDDAALSVVHALHAPLHLASAQIFNVGGNAENYTIGRAAELIHQVVPTAVIKEIPFDGDRRNYKVRFDKAARDLRFQPMWRLEQGIIQVSDAIRSGRIKSYRDPQYSNVLFLNSNGVVGSLNINDGAGNIERMITEEVPEKTAGA